jgi:hypothetical protein
MKKKKTKKNVTKKKGKFFDSAVPHPQSLRGYMGGSEFLILYRRRLSPSRLSCTLPWLEIQNHQIHITKKKKGEFFDSAQPHRRRFVYIACCPHMVIVASPFPLKLLGIWPKREVNTNTYVGSILT